VTSLDKLERNQESTSLEGHAFSRRGAKRQACLLARSCPRYNSLEICPNHFKFCTISSSSPLLSGCSWCMSHSGLLVVLGCRQTLPEHLNYGITSIQIKAGWRTGLLIMSPCSSVGPPDHKIWIDQFGNSSSTFHRPYLLVVWSLRRVTTSLHNMSLTTCHPSSPINVSRWMPQFPALT